MFTNQNVMTKIIWHVFRQAEVILYSWQHITQLFLHVNFCLIILWFSCNPIDWILRDWSDESLMLLRTWSCEILSPHFGLFSNLYSHLKCHIVNESCNERSTFTSVKKKLKVKVTHLHPILLNPEPSRACWPT